MNDSNDNHPLIPFVDTPQTMTSIEIAEVTGKPHNDVLKAIRKMEPAWEKVTQGKFSLCMRISELANGVKKQNPYYTLTKTQCLYVATKFNDEARAKLVIRWEQLEKERLPAPATVPAAPPPGPTSPFSRRQFLLLSLQAEEELEQLREHNRQLQHDVCCMALELGRRYDIIQRLLPSGNAAPPVSCQQKQPTDCATRSTEVAYTATQLASLYGMKAVSFNNLLQQLGIQQTVNGQWVIATDYAGNGYTATRHITVTDDNGQSLKKPFTVWTEAGRTFLQQALRQKGIVTAGEEKANKAKARKGGVYV